VTDFRSVWEQYTNHSLEKLHVANIVVKIAPYRQTKCSVTNS